MVWDQDAINYIQSQVGNITYEHSFLLNRNQGSIHGPETWALWKTGWLNGQPEYISAESNLPNWYVDTSVLQDGAGEVAEYTIGTANAKALEAGVTYWSQLVLEPGDDPDCTTANHIVCESAQLIADLGYHFANCNIIKPPFCIDDSAHTHLNELGSSGTYWTIDIPSIYHWPRQVVENTPTSISQPPTPVVSTPTRSSTTPTPVATSGAQVSCSNIGWFNQAIAHTFSEKNCLGDSSWNSEWEPNGPSRSRQKSIYVPAGKVLWIYEHNNREGKSECLSGSVADLSAIGWENWIESAYLESGSCFVPTPIATIQVKEVRFYKESNFEGGRAFTLPEGDHRPSDHGFFNRFPMFNSMKICKGCVVTIWDSQSDDSKCWVFDEDKVGSHGLYGQDAVRILISASPNPVCEPWHAKYSSPQKEAVYALGEDIVIGWRAGDDFSDRFTVEVWNQNNNLIYNQVRSTVQTYTLRGLPVGKYFIRMQSHWGSNYSEWRDRYFYVMANPTKPEIRLPYENQVFRPGDEVDVHWGRTDLTTTEFKTQLWCNWELLEETGRVTYGSKWFGPLPEGDCMAQVESFNPVGSSGWTQRLFKVRPEPPASPDIYHPKEGHGFHSRYTVLIAWYPIPTATEYNVELWGPNGLVESWIGTRELVLVAGHLPQGTYRVRIHSLDKWGQYQEWKDTTFFTVDPTPTAIPTYTPIATATNTTQPTAVATATEIVPTSTNTPRVTSTPVLTATSTVVASRTPVPTNTPRPTSTSVPATSTPGSGQPTGERIYLPLVMR